LSIFKALLTLLFLLLLTLTSYILLKDTHQKEKLPLETVYIKQMTLPKTNENEEIILSHLKQYIDKNKKHTDSIQTNESDILKELKLFTSQNISQKDLITSIKSEGSLIKKEIQTLSLNINKKIDKEVKVLRKEIKTINKIEQSNGIFSSAYELKPNEKSLRYGEIETIKTTVAYKMDDVAPIDSPIDVSVENSNIITEELNLVETLGIVNISEPYLSTDEVM